ncbi:acyl-CoA Delta-9 desaturase-like [Venturia canescens]|uniref:acyl-CoA Delta-9 desaturase-like n=1 Tax=Venturia canescens TaxID=32260 RepID=UPI001C9BFFC7|nr:acyl-CoA Delta-9 desaturase-like [Venturia canescens]XP_043273755.1 acyl-CoA Delta-9 desaturase-like [Venturia canescens]
MSPDEERIPTTMPIQEVEVGVPSSPKIVEPEICEMKQRKGGHANEEESLEVGVDKPVEYVPALKWPDLLAQIFIHVGFVYGFGLIFTKAKLLTSLWALFLIIMSGFGITAGAHRLWSHRAYKAEWPLRLILVFLFTIAGQRHVYAWALDHRVHHKYSETDADPHNAKRGFFFAHVGWLFTTPHPDVVAKRKAVDMSDLEADPIVMWQKRLYVPLFALLAIGLPVWVPWYFWDESLWTSFWVNFNFRFGFTLNSAFLVNSVAHMWGQKPYDKYISPAENVMVSVVAMGEGWHNYHHVFPWDYKTGELGDYSLNVTTGFIDAFAKIGWAYDRKHVSRDMIRRRANRSGDGTHVWGYGDVDVSKEDREELERMSDDKSI